tara:strand:- start:5399 stop:6106 length:708 start_codon:yes stop_codon:yes gene_type:complete
MTTNYNNLLKTTNTNVKDPFWYDDIRVLFNYNRLDEFFPTYDMTVSEQLNSVVRLSIYLSIIFFIYTNSANSIYISLIVLLFTYFVYSNSDYKLYTDTLSHINSKKGITKEKYSKQLVSPTIDNPFMNISYDDYIKNPNRESLNKANNYINPKLNEDIFSKFKYNLYKDSDDIYNKKASQRQFYTMPVTTIPNQQTRFANWLYKTPPTCKEGNGERCVSNNFEFLKDSEVRNGIF